LCQLITQPSYIIDALQRARGEQWLPQHLQSRKQALRKAQAGISQQLERLTEAYLLAIIPLAEYQRRRSELEQKSQALEVQTKELEAHVDRQAELIQLGSSIEDFCRRIHAGLANATFDQKRALVELLIDRVLVADGEVEIRYVVPTHPNSEKVRFCHLRKDYLDHVVQVLTAADPDRVLPTEIELVAHTHAAEGGVRRLETVKRDGSRLAMALQRLAEERLAAATSRVRLRCDSTVRPRSSTARYKYIQRPATLTYVSSQRQERPTGLARCRQDSASAAEYRITQRRIVQGATVTPIWPMS
jgi:hypothetical protein